MSPLPYAIAIALMTAPPLATPAALVQLGAAQPTARTEALVGGVFQAWLAAEWQGYASKFVTPEGRVVDNANGGVSHSEGQGYGLLLAAKAGDAARFETLWRWTARTLAVRPDGLLAWKWDPATHAVADTNNATDGDILVAWALWEGATRFNRPDYRDAAGKIARALAAAVIPSKSGPVLLPGLQGFRAGEQPDGPVINLSYWVFPAFAALRDLAPEVNWAAVRRTGLALVEGSRFGAPGLPSDWESLAGPRPRPAANFAAGFGYNAIRIPLYLAFDGGEDARRALRRFADLKQQTASALPVGDVPATAAVPVGEAGYALVLAAARCVSAGVAVPPEAISARSTLYYPETLRLLSVIALRERSPACL